MLEKRPFTSLGHANYGWLDAHYHFSFSHYFDENRTGWGALKVWNDDIIDPKRGFERHGHRDMEIITFVREGVVTHKDHLGNEGRTPAGEVQVMTAGKGILHEEWNLEDTPTTLFQIWITPRKKGTQPGWQQAQFPRADKSNQLITLASGYEADIQSGALPIGADAKIMAATLNTGQNVTANLNPARYAYLVVSKGQVSVNGTQLNARDGLAIRDEQTLTITNNGSDSAEIILADVNPE